MRRISTTTFRIARRGTSREINRQIALNLVRSKQPISRADLARLMGVRRGAISRLVQDLLRAKQVFEGAKGESKRGRKPRHLYIETRRRCAMAVDISASRTLMLVTDPLGHPLLDVVEFPTPPRPDGLVKRLARDIDRILAEHPEMGECLGVGVVIAGLVDIDRGRVRYAPTLGWRDLDLRDPLQAATGLPVMVENDVKACVLAQVWAVRGHAPVDGTVAYRERVRWRRRGHRHRWTAPPWRPQQRRRARSRDPQHGRATVRLRTEGLLGGLRLGPGHGRPLPRHRPFLARIGRAQRYHGRDHHRPRSRRRSPGPGDAARRRATTSAAGSRRSSRPIEPRRVYMSGEITDAWDLVLPSVQQALREQALVREAEKTEIVVVPLGEHPRLRGAAALVNSPVFAAPVVA